MTSAFGAGRLLPLWTLVRPKPSNPITTDVTERGAVPCLTSSAFRFRPPWLGGKAMAKEIKEINNPSLFWDACAPGQPQRFYTELTLLDLLAGMAMEGLIVGGIGEGSSVAPPTVAKSAYEFARAMLEERERIFK